MKIGTMSVLLEFLDLKSRVMFNLLCKHVYRVVMPAVSGRFVINAHIKFGEWLEWGKDESVSGVKVQRGLSIKIGSEEGICYGEWQETGYT